MMRLLTFAAAVLFSTATFAQTSPPPAAATPPKSDATPPKPFVYTPKPSDVPYGKPGAPVTIVEYASLSCPHCSHFYNETMPKLEPKYIDTGKVFFVYRNYPLNKPALEAAQMVACAPADSRHAYIKVLFATQQKWAFDYNFETALAGIAGLGGMDRATFDACIKDKAGETAALEVAKEAQDNYQLHSTPSFFINGVLHEGDAGFEGTSKLIDDALAAAAKK